MWNGIGQVQEERGPLAGFDEIDGARRQQIVRILPLHTEIFRNIEFVLVFPQMVRIKSMGVALIEISEPFIEALQIGNTRSPGAAQSPLAEDAGPVARALQHGGHGYIGGLKKHVVPVSTNAAMSDVL